MTQETQPVVVDVRAATRSYHVMIGDGLATRLGALLEARRLTGPTIIVTSPPIWRLHGPTIAAALPGAVASFTHRPVIGVPVSGKVNLDSILSIVQMPPGVPVACVGLDRGDNAALLAVSMLSISDPALAKELADYRREMAEKGEKDSEEVQA